MLKEIRVKGPFVSLTATARNKLKGKCTHKNVYEEILFAAWPKYENEWSDYHNETYPVKRNQELTFQCLPFETCIPQNRISDNLNISRKILQRILRDLERMDLIRTTHPYGKGAGKLAFISLIGIFETIDEVREPLRQERAKRLNNKEQINTKTHNNTASARADISEKGHNKKPEFNWQNYREYVNSKYPELDATYIWIENLEHAPADENILLDHRAEIVKYRWSYIDEVCKKELNEHGPAVKKEDVPSYDFIHDWLNRVSAELGIDYQDMPGAGVSDWQFRVSEFCERYSYNDNTTYAKYFDVMETLLINYFAGTIDISGLNELYRQFNPTFISDSKPTGEIYQKYGIKYNAIKSRNDYIKYLKILSEPIFIDHENIEFDCLESNYAA